MRSQALRNGVRWLVSCLALAILLSPGMSTLAYATDAGVVTQAAASCHVAYATHVQRQGWQRHVSDGELSGTIGLGLRVEACRVRVLDADGVELAGAVQCRAHVQDVGWQPWVTDGEMAGTQGRGLRIEALMIRLCGPLATSHDIYYRVHVQRKGWLAWAKDGCAVGSVGQALRVEALQVMLCEKGGAAPRQNVTGARAFLGTEGLSLSAHVSELGWMASVGDAGLVGTTGRALGLEAFTARVENLPYDGTIRYAAHVQGIGWQNERTSGGVAGTTGRALRVEAVTFRLDGELAHHYDIFYRAHVQDYGWLGWARDGAQAGTAGMAKRVEALQVMLVAKGEVAPSDPGFADDIAFVSGASVSYAVELPSGRQGKVADGAMAGTTGQGCAIRGLSASVVSADGIEGGLSYAVARSGRAWGATAANGMLATTGGDLESVRLWLTGTLSRLYDIYYRVHVGNFGWADWTKDGQAAGSGDYGYKLEALELRLVPKGNTPPGATAYPYFDRGSFHIGQLLGEANVRQVRLVTVAHTTPSPGAGLCAAWVEDVIARAGYGYHLGDARDLYAAYCHTSDIHALKVGMIVSVSRHSHTRLGSIYGHVGIYVGDGLLMDNVGAGVIRTITLKEWMAWYGDLVPVRWGWLGNRALA